MEEALKKYLVLLQSMLTHLQLMVIHHNCMSLQGQTIDHQPTNQRSNTWNLTILEAMATMIINQFTTVTTPYTTCHMKTMNHIIQRPRP
jgi:DNA polymerase III psi subunit